MVSDAKPNDTTNIIATARELCEYVANSPDGWCGEAYEVAEDLLRS